MNTTNYVNIWILSLWSIAICDEVCHMFLNDRTTYHNWYDTIVSGGFLSVDLTVPTVDL